MNSANPSPTGSFDMDHSKPTLMMFCDASFYEDDGVMGWAGWARGDDHEPRYFSGQGPKVKSATMAEAIAISKTLTEMKRAKMFGLNDTHMMIQSDSLLCLNYIHHLAGNTWPAKVKNGGASVQKIRRIPPQYRVITKEIVDFITPMSCVYLRHVRAHQGGKNARSHVNETCDRLAKKEARKRLVELRDA